MKSPQKLLFALILCILLAAKADYDGLQGCFSSPSALEPCDDEQVVTYSLPSPLVNTTLTVFTQNESFMNAVTEVSNQIAQQIVTAIQEAEAASSMNSILNTFTSGVLDVLGLENDGPTISDVETLFDTLASIIGQEVQLSSTQAEVSNYTSDFQSWINTLNQLEGESAQSVQEQLMDLSIQLEEAFSNFQTNPTFYQYAYYTFQPLYINAVLHVNVLYLLALAEQAVGYNDSEYYQNEAVSMQQSYLTLLQNYSSQTGSYRGSFITQVNCFEEEVMGSCPLVGEEGEDCYPTLIYNYSFQDNFLTSGFTMTTGTTVATGITVVLEEDYSEGNCPVTGAAMLAAQSSYVQAVESGTTAYFDLYVTSYSNYNPNQ